MDGGALAAAAAAYCMSYDTGVGAMPFPSADVTPAEETDSDGMGTGFGLQIGGSIMVDRSSGDGGRRCCSGRC